MTSPSTDHVPVRPGFDHSDDPTLLQDHYSEWNRLREAHGAFRTDIADDLGYALWYVLRHEDQHDILRDPQRFSSRSMSYLGDGPQKMLPIQLDPPEHGPYRQLLVREFSPGAVAARETAVRARCGELLDGIVPKGGCDYTNEFAFRLPTAIFLEMMGLDVDRTDEFVALAKTMIGTSNERDPDFSIRGGAALGIVGHLVEGIEARRSHPRHDLLSLLVASDIDGEPLSDDDLIAYGFLLYLAGLDTVANVLSYAMRHFAEHPELRRDLVANPDRWPSAVEEILRHFGIPSLVRVVVDDTEVAGCPMRAGDRIVLPLASANRDPEAFPDPETFDPDRIRNRHLAFGAGPHRCLGAHLARLELRIAMEEWHARIPDYAVDPSAVIHEHVGAVAGMDSLPLVWDR